MVKKSPRGFTLIELLTVVAIIALLAAIAIPQFMKFQMKSKRTEAMINLGGAHKGQTAYYAAHDSYKISSLATMFPIGGGVYMSDAIAASTINVTLGLPCVDGSHNLISAPGNYSAVMTPSIHYNYIWYFVVNPGQAPNYELDLDTVFTNGGDDLLFVGVNTSYSAACSSVGYQDGVPFLWRDGILNTPPKC